MKTGRPPKYETAEELQEKIEEYFNEEGIKYTIAGLCLYLGFESRQSFYDLSKNDKFSYTIKRARLMLQDHYEGLLQGNNVTGAIFALKNLGYTDKQEIDHTTKGKEVASTRIDLSNLSTEILEQIIKSQDS